MLEIRILGRVQGNGMEVDKGVVIEKVYRGSEGDICSPKTERGSIKIQGIIAFESSDWTTKWASDR